MNLTSEELSMLAGDWGRSVKKSMEILVALGTIYGAERMIPVTSVQVAGVSYDNLGEAGLEFLDDMANGGGKARVLTTLNPAGMDVENPAALGIDADFARNQQRVIGAFTRMDILPTCSCTPYLFGNLPHFGEHIAWAESSAVCYANSVLGARTNREGGPSALASALTGRTPAYGVHLDENRAPELTVNLEADLSGTADFGALGLVIGKKIEGSGKKPAPYITGVREASLENLKSFCASLATYGGAALFHIQGITREAPQYLPPTEIVTITQKDIEEAARSLNNARSEEVDFVSLGCPHLSIAEIARLADLLRGRQVKKTFWITTSRPVKGIADRMGYSQVIEAAGAVFATDTCCVVSPIRGRFHALATDSAKACYYAASKNHFKTRLLSFDEVVQEALR
jgi:predicted aconitase